MFEMTVFGHARVSTEGQSPSAQLAELKAAGAQRIFQEKVPGARSDRKQLRRLLAELDDGDAVFVTRLDRLARSTRDLLNILATIGEARASFRFLHDAWAATTTPHGRLILTVLGGLAEFERHLIVARTSEGRQRAKARGVLFGRPPKLTAQLNQRAGTTALGGVRPFPGSPHRPAVHAEAEVPMRPLTGSLRRKEGGLLPALSSTSDCRNFQGPPFARMTKIWAPPPAA
jgi:DNA invertase Pin-like site-specific DNA recombinase